MIRRIHLLPVLIFLALAACRNEDNNLKPALATITCDDLKKNISVLASDEFEGRAPSTRGEEKTINYLAEQFRQLGLEPANDGSYFQEVSLLKITPDNKMHMDIKGPEKSLSLRFSDEFIGGSPQPSENINIEGSDVVFVGYGINSPEYNWNDYEGVDVKGKTVLMLVNDPGYATNDTSLFTGKAMTYYGRWTYKYEEAARQGAKAAIIIHETGAAAYPWAVVQNSWEGPKFYLENNELIGSEIQLTSWVTTESAQKMFEAAGMNYEEILKAAATRGFKPVEMNLKVSVEFSNKVEHTKSNNVAAIWPGSDRSDEYIIYSAHWDHFGINSSFKGDSILNGAVDNASGSAALLTIAKAFISLPEKQNRSILFLAVTGEEQGLLGSEYYAQNPIFPLASTVGVINIDALNILGETKDMTIIGYGNSQLDDYAADVLKIYSRYDSQEATPDKGGYFRSDHFSFAKAGVPSINLTEGADNIQHGRDWALAQSEKWTMENYHKPSDNYEPEKWDFNGMLADVKIYFEVGYRLSISEEFPQWNENFPFKYLRDEMMGR